MVSPPIYRSSGPPTDVVLRYGLFTGLSLAVIHLLFYYVGWVPGSMYWLFLRFVLAMLISGALLVLAIRQVRHRDGGYISAGRILYTCLLISLAAGLVLALYDIVFYRFIDPELDLKILVSFRQQLIEISQANQVPTEQLKSQLADLDERIALEKAASKSAAVLLVGRLGIQLLFGGIYGIILGIILRTPPPPKA